MAMVDVKSLHFQSLPRLCKLGVHLRAVAHGRTLPFFRRLLS